MEKKSFFFSNKNKDLIKKALAHFEQEAEKIDGEEIKGGEQQHRGADWLEMGRGELNTDKH
jgi:hypothetical protein